MDEDLQAYIEGISPENRALFDRVDRLIHEVCPDIEMGFAYRMPTYVLGENGRHIASWKHGLSFYGWRDRNGGFADRHPELAGEKGTIRLPPKVAEGIDDVELTDFFRAVFVG